MPRSTRVDVAGEIYHVINRANAQVQIFNVDKDYQLFENVLLEAKERTDVKIYSYCLMPNHWHLVLSPKTDGDLSKFMGWLTMTHTQRWHAIHQSTGTGHLYQGRYKSFLVQSSEYFLQVCRYVERNSVRAKLVSDAKNWRWSSFWIRENGSVEKKKMLNEWPVDMPENYKVWVNEIEPKEELKSLRHSIKKGKPYGSDSWTDKITDLYKLEATLRNPGRPKKGS